MTQTGWLKTMEICSFTILDVRSLMSTCQQSHAFSETLGRIHPYLFLAFQWWLSSLVIPWLLPDSFWSPPLLLRGCVCVCLHASSYKDPSDIELSPPIISHLNSNLQRLWDKSLQIRFDSQALGLRMPT